MHSSQLENSTNLYHGTSVQLDTLPARCDSFTEDARARFPENIDGNSGVTTAGCCVGDCLGLSDALKGTKVFVLFILKSWKKR